VISFLEKIVLRRSWFVEKGRIKIRPRFWLFAI
jgi:hypothetical protein